MKLQLYLFGILLILGSKYTSVSAQTDTLNRLVTKNESINLNLLWYTINYGTISWEKSTDAINWQTAEGETTKNYKFAADSDSYYRAKVLSGTCDPIYSRITKLQVLNISTDSVSDITETSVSVHCTIYTDTIAYPEKGIFYDTKTIPDQNSASLVSHSVNPEFSLQIESLDTGKTYFVRTYVKNTEGTYFLGNIISFSTPSVKALNIVNITQTSIHLFYSVSATPKAEEHGLFYMTSVNESEIPVRVDGTEVNGSYSAVINNLLPAKTYYVYPFIKVNGKYYYDKIQEIKTFTDYNSYPIDNSSFTVAHKIVWNAPSTAKKISQQGYFGDYGRIKRVGNTDTLVLVYHGGPNNGDWLNICMRMSYDNGTSWTNQKILMNILDYIADYWRFCNPEVLVLRNGWVLVAFEANAKQDENKSSIQILISKDTCKTWEGPVIHRTGRTWEPAMVELPGGEIELFYSSEGKWWPNSPLLQEIMRISSTDHGYSWSEAKTVAWYPSKRDGMPVPLLLQGNKGVVFTIECVNSNVSPFIIKRNLSSEWFLENSNFLYSPYRYVVSNFSGHGGAPYLLQLPTGEVLLSAHIYRGGDWHQNNYMQAMVGDNSAKNFSQLSTPWGILPTNESAVNNSLFLKDSETVVAVSCRMSADGSGGIYWLEGKIVPL